MKKLTLLLTIFALACSSTPRKPASMGMAPLPMAADSLTLEQALKQGQEPTLAHLKSSLKSSSFTELPQQLKVEKAASPVVSEKRQRQVFIRKFHPWSFNKKMARASELISDFKCENSQETQALGLVMEVHFPDEKAAELAEALHEKASTCDFAQKEDSLLRLTVLSIYKNQCPKALQHLEKLPPASERGNTDRISYLRNLCAPQSVVEKRNPWGGYGIQLGDLEIAEPKNPVWFLSANSGSSDWDQLLMTFIELVEKGENHKVRYMASKMNYEKFKTLPYPFQTSVLVLMHFAGADLAVFQSLHKFLSENPQLITKEVVGLLFPVRFWETIVKNSNGLDPLLVKSLIRQESAFDPKARSHARAFGLTQVIFPTARIYGLKTKKQLFNPEDNVRVGSVFLKRLIDNFGSVELALAAYNAGPEKVKEWQKRYPTENKDLFVEMIPYAETREYVRLVLRNYKIYKNVLMETQPKSDLAQLPLTP